MNITLNKNTFDKTNAVIAAVLWLSVLAIYNMTKAASLSFWDCGEFIAASAILGVPHPPGTPLYIIVGRIFSIIPWVEDIGQRINFLSALSSSFTALFGYLTGVRILRTWFVADSGIFAKILIYAGGFSGALFLAFGLTNWTNSIEAEVYGLSMMLLMAIFWLTLKYIEEKGKPASDRIMLLVVYLAFCGIGVHMTTFIAFPVLALFFILKSHADKKIWFILASFFFFEFYLIFALSSLSGEIAYYIPLSIVFVLFLFFMFSFEQIQKIYVIASCLFVLSIFPVFGHALKLINGSVSVPISTTFNYIGYTGTVFLFIFGMFAFYKYFSLKKKTMALEYLMVGLFILAALVMLVFLFFFKGYKPFLIVSTLTTLALLAVLYKDINWGILIAIGGSCLVIFGIYPFFWGMVIAAGIILTGGVIKKLPDWKSSLLIILMAAMGFSVHAFIPIRSAQQPMINENNPSENLTATVNYLERKQYGSMSMTERMFMRRAEWSNQFGVHSRMGFWGFFSEQYGINGIKFVLILLLGIFGIWEIIRRRPDHGLSLFVLLLLSSVGLILYMNFADGTRDGITGIDYLEVRDRDYFFTPAFIIFGLAIGIGISVLIQFLRESIQGFNQNIKNLILCSSLILFLLPTYTIAHNYYLCDRSENYIAYDYATNILSTADENAILFTGGDNDTFPLWGLQEAYGYRKDVKNANLSLANTKWYIKQLKNTMGINLGWSDKDIDNLRPFRTQDGTIFRLNNQVVDAIIANNIGKVPINFSVSTSAGSRVFMGKPLEDKIRLHGMVYQVDTSLSAMEIDKKNTIDFYLNPERFKARGLNNPAVYKNETTMRLTRNYTNGILILAENLRQAGDSETCEILAKRAMELIPHAENSVNYLAQIYARQGRTADIQELIDENRVSDNKTLFVQLARAYENINNIEEAVKIYEVLLLDEPNNKSNFNDLLRIYYNNQQASKMHQLMKRWMEFNKDDNEVMSLLKQFENQLIRNNQNPVDTSGK